MGRWYLARAGVRMLPFLIGCAAVAWFGIAVIHTSSVWGTQARVLGSLVLVAVLTAGGGAVALWRPESLRGEALTHWISQRVALKLTRELLNQLPRGPYGRSRSISIVVGDNGELVCAYPTRGELMRGFIPFCVKGPGRSTKALFMYGPRDFGHEHNPQEEVWWLMEVGFFGGSVIDWPGQETKPAPPEAYWDWLIRNLRAAIDPRD